MFEGFARVWTPLTRAAGVRRAPVRIVLAGTPLVVFAGEGGRIGALVDRCPHRGVALSLGRPCPDGALACPFHGWRFDVDGRNLGVPFNPSARLETLGATALPTRVIGEMVWVFTAPAGGPPPPEPAFADALADPSLSRVYVERVWDCHWTRAMENMLDSAHLPFVHRRTIGRSLLRPLAAGEALEVAWEDTASGGFAHASAGGRTPGARLDFFRPNMMQLTIPIPGRRLHVHAICAPEAEGRTRLTVVGSRDFLRAGLLDPLFAWSNGRIADEDRAVVQSSGPDEVPPPAAEHSVATDRATLAFRRWYYAALREGAV